MAKIVCSKCKLERPQLSESPLPGELGQKLVAQTCENCWQLWTAQQLMLINEYRLDPLNEEHSKFLDEEMLKFLSIDDAGQ